MVERQLHKRLPQAAQRDPAQRAGSRGGADAGFWWVSTQYTGQVVGPLPGGFLGGHYGMRAVFPGTCVLMAGGAFWNWRVRR